MFLYAALPLLSSYYITIIDDDQVGPDDSDHYHSNVHNELTRELTLQITFRENLKPHVQLRPAPAEKTTNSRHTKAIIHL